MASRPVLQMPVNTTDGKLSKININKAHFTRIRLNLEQLQFSIQFVTCRPALADLETALALAFPESFPALPPA